MLREKRSIIIQTSRSSHPVYKMLSGSQAFSYDEVVKLLLQERRDLGFPPYRRIVDILVRDSSAARLQLMASRLVSVLRQPAGGVISTSSMTAGGILAATGGAMAAESLSFTVTDPFNPTPWEADLLRIRIILPRGSEAAEAKRAIFQTVAAFEKQNSYPGHIHFDVDPV